MGALQAKLTINEPGDQYELEADCVSELVTRMEAPDIARTAPPAIQRLGARAQANLAAKHLQRLCAGCEEDQETEKSLQRRAGPTGPLAGGGHALRQAEMTVEAVSGGQPLTREQRSFFEPRFGADFSHVRIHADSGADSAARAVGALAYTRGRDIVFRSGEYQPDTRAGRHLLAHELTHVVQQGATVRLTHSPGLGGQHIQRQISLPKDPNAYPGQGLKPPGTCSKATYKKVRAGVSLTKGLSKELGGCKEKPGDCTQMFLKIVAGAMEIAARLVEMAVCFKGGNRNHWIPVENKYRMIEACLSAMKDKDCDQKLLDKVVEILKRAAEIIAIGAAIILAIALIVVFAGVIFAAIAAAWAAIAAAGAAAIAAVGAPALSLAGTAAAILLLLQLLPEDGPGGPPAGGGGPGGPPTKLKA